MWKDAKCDGYKGTLDFCGANLEVKGKPVNAPVNKTEQKTKN